ncbi:hypothetical protein AKJ65_01800 [candidate division MSBL1 archaeon SCGC-AAA259E19]|uniref:Uncharacterized protein n=1 Tax=candidate division MSBL1 archaeon SCGC-AAA259E19 TaxID=1698264 RepID=A0A133UMR3_9EURY|nr:hypothetical protein AKJ65_01800 [candidate division MSBL1 archaeon SCGC-AAA259E19]
MAGNCKYGDFECPFDEPPKDPNECRACATLKNVKAQRKAVQIQERSMKLQTISSLITASQALPYEEKEFQDEIIEKAKISIKNWLESEEE